LYSAVFLYVAFEVFPDAGAKGFGALGSMTPLFARILNPITGNALTKMIPSLSEYEKAVHKADAAAQRRKIHVGFVSWAFALPGALVALAVVVMELAAEGGS